MTATTMLKALPACRDLDPVIFFPEGCWEGSRDEYRKVSEAKRICVTCPVRTDCLRAALDRHEPEGIWGGCTPLERRQLLRDMTSLQRDVSQTVRRLEDGVWSPVRHVEFLAVVHQLSRRGWQVDAMGRALGVTAQIVAETRARAQRAAACETAA